MRSFLQRITDRRGWFRIDSTRRTSSLIAAKGTALRRNVFLLSGAVAPLNLAIPLPQLDVTTINKLLDGFDGLAFILANQVDKILHAPSGPKINARYSCIALVP
jgi:hypothetical protein